MLLSSPNVIMMHVNALLRLLLTRVHNHSVHAVKLHEVPDDSLAELLVIAKKIAVAQGGPEADYNILQNNGRNAHQVTLPLHPSCSYHDHEKAYEVNDDILCC